MRVPALTFLGMLHAVLLGCASDPAPVAAAKTADSVDVSDAIAGVQSRGAVIAYLAHVKLLTDAAIAQGSTIDVTKSAGVNADALAARLQSGVKGQVNPKAAKCPALDITHTPGVAKIDLTFPTSGCSIREQAISGIVTVTVTAKDGAISVVFDLNPLTVNSHKAKGKVTLITSDGNAFAVSIPGLVVDADTYAFEGTEALDAGGKDVAIDGTGSIAKTGDSVLTQFSAAGIVHSLQGCYAKAGKLVLAGANTPKVGAAAVKVTTTVQFDQDSPRDGTVDVTVQVGEKAAPVVKKDVTLAPYGTCPDGTSP